MNRHAYLILAHTNPGQLRKLIGALDDPRNDVFVHIDAKAPFGPEDLAGACSQSRLVFTDRRIPVSWGGVSIMRAELELLGKACSEGSYSYYHLLSGMDMPIKSQDAIHSFFEQNQGKEFLNMWTFQSHTYRRFRYFTLFPEGAGHFATNLLNNLVKMILVGLHLQINKGIDFRFASQWFSITDGFARYTLSKRNWLEKVFRHTNTIDEVFMPTLLWNSPFKDRLYDPVEHPDNKDTAAMGNMRFIDWTRGPSIRHPWTFTKDDLELLRSVPQLWARKFDERVDTEIIDAVIRDLLH